MALKFLNKKGWHTGSLRNIENVWKAEQKHGAEQKKLEELRKQIQEERERTEFRQLQESAGLVPRQERLDFLYESGLGVGKGSSEGFKALQAPPPPKADTSAAATSADAGGAAAASSSSKAAAPGALFEDKPQSANDTWRKLHSDPLLLIRQREQEALSRIKNNPVQMAMIQKSVEAEKKHKEKGDKKEKREKKEHKKKHQHSKSKHGKCSYTADSDSDPDGSTEQKEVKRKRDHPTYERHGEHQARHEKCSSRSYSYSEEVSKEIEGKRKRDHSTSEVNKEMEGRRHRDRQPPEEVNKARHDKRSSRAYSNSEVSKEIEGERKRNCSGHEMGKEKEGKRHRNQPPPEEVNKEMEGRRQRDRPPPEVVNQEMEGIRQRGRPEQQVHQKSRDYSHRSGHSDSDDAVHDKERGKNVRLSADHHYSGHGRGSENRHNGYNHRWIAPKLSEEERAARLQEMQLNAELHEEQRWKRLKTASEADAHEANKDKPSLGSSNFLDAAHKSIYGTEKGGSSTIEESVRRRTYFSQGGTAANESNAFRR